jgi:hypothetical protein
MFFVWLLAACNTTEKGKIKATTNDSLVAKEYKLKTGIDVEPVIARTDSLQILYYDNPDGDSLKYTRFYTHTNNRDSGTINLLLAELNNPFELRNELKKCRSEGKLYLYGEKESLKTIYFSTRCDSCCYLYFIKDGAFLYFPLSKNFNNIINKNKVEAKKS